jgi:hypothetical protein
MDTEQLVQRLVAGARPVVPLRRPWVRTAAWCAAAAAYVGVLILLMLGRDGVQVQRWDLRFLLEQAAGLATGVAAAAVALAATVPGYSPRLWRVPLVLFGVWIAAVAIGAWADARTAASGAPLLTSDWRCVAVIVAGASVPGAALMLMLRRGAPLAPRVSAGLGGLAAAGVGALAACVQPHASNLVVLLWHGGTVLVLASVAAIFGTRLLPWQSSRRPTAVIG